MIDRGADDTLRPVLKQVENQLDSQLAEACKAPPAAEETTGQLQRLSETLAGAAESARAAAALRRRLRAERAAERRNADKRAARDAARPVSPPTDGKGVGTPARGVEARRAEVKREKE